jgi:hypothetical protein
MPLILNGSGTLTTNPSTTAINIDANSRVQLNNGARPYSLVRFNSSDYGAYNNMMVNNYARPTRIDANVGGCYDSNNGRFTAPIAGAYMFTFSTNFYMTNAPAWIAPSTHKNGVLWAYHYGDRYTGSWQYFQFAEVHQLVAGDYLQIYYASPGQTYGSDLATYSPITFTYLG